MSMCVVFRTPHIYSLGNAQNVMPTKINDYCNKPRTCIVGGQKLTSCSFQFVYPPVWVSITFITFLPHLYIPGQFSDGCSFLVDLLQQVS